MTHFLLNRKIYVLKEIIIIIIFFFCVIIYKIKFLNKIFFFFFHGQEKFDCSISVTKLCRKIAKCVNKRLGVIFQCKCNA